MHAAHPESRHHDNPGTPQRDANATQHDRTAAFIRFGAGNEPLFYDNSIDVRNCVEHSLASAYRLPWRRRVDNALRGVAEFLIGAFTAAAWLTLVVVATVVLSGCSRRAPECAKLHRGYARVGTIPAYITGIDAWGSPAARVEMPGFDTQWVPCETIEQDLPK